MTCEYDIDRQAIALGAVKKVTFWVERRGYSYRDEPSRDAYSWSYFRADGLEIAYCTIPMMGFEHYGIPDLKILETPRLWDPVMLQKPCYTHTDLPRLLCDV